MNKRKLRTIHQLKKEKKEKRFLISFGMTVSLSFRAKRRIYTAIPLLDTVPF